MTIAVACFLFLAGGAGVASADTILAITPSTIGVDSQPVMRFTGAVPSPTTMVAFALSGECDSARVGTTALGSADTAPLGEAIPAANVYFVCYSIDAGSTWIQQTTPRLTVVTATPTSITTISPSAIGAATTPVMTFTGAVPTTTTAIAFALSGQCSTGRVGTTVLDSSDTGPLGEAIITPGTYAVCYTVNNINWVEQSAPLLRVVTATPTSIIVITPTTIGLNTTPVMTFSGLVATPTTVIAFALSGQCNSARVGTTVLDDSDTGPLGEAIVTPGTYAVCYTVDGVDWFQQATLHLTVVTATPTSISAVSPTAIGAGTTPVMTLTGAVATPTTRFAFALSGQCATNRIGTTVLDDSDTGPLGEAIPISGTYALCYTVNNIEWVQQTAPLLRVVVATPTTITLITPSTIIVGTTPVLTFTGAVATPTTLIAFARPGQCGTTRVGATVLDSGDTAPLGETITEPNVYRVCYSVNGGGSWVEQTASVLLRVTRGDPFVGYQIKAPKKDASGTDIAGNSFPKGWAISIDDTVLALLDPGATDNPENYLVKKEKSLLLPAQQDDRPAPDLGGLHYLRYQASSAKEGIQPAVNGKFPKPIAHAPRVWSLESDSGNLQVQSAKVTAVLVPTTAGASAPPAPPADATHFLCYQVAAVKGDLQAFVRDQFDDCANDVTGAPSFSGAPVQGMCLLDLASTAELCNPMNKTAVEAPRATTAVIDESTATTTTSLLCFKAKLSSTIKTAETAALAASALGPPIAVGDAVDPKQSKHVPRSVKNGNPLYAAPGNLFPAPTVVDSVKRERVCIPADVVSVSPVP